MNQCAIQQNRVDRSRDEMRSSFAAVGSTMFMPDHHHHHHRWDAVVCPKPRRTGLPINCPSGSFSYHMSHQAEHNTSGSGSKEGSELLDIILPMGGHDNDIYYTNTTNSTQVASSPSPFFYGSPPIRVSNPLIQDVRFKDPLPSSPTPSSGGARSPLPPTSSPVRKVGFVRAHFGNKPAVRVEGFDCLDRDRSRNCSIPALA